MLEVNKNVPIPKLARAALPSRRKYPFEEMEIGDMFFVPNKDKNTLTTHASAMGRQLKRKFITRLTTMRMTSEGWALCDPGQAKAVQGIGVWRTL